MSTPPGERYPLAPLYRLAELRWGVSNDKATPPPGCRGATRAECRSFSDKVFAEMIGSQAREVVRWRGEGMTLRKAERAAIAIGLTVHLVWPSIYWSSCPPERSFEPGDRPCLACEGPIPASSTAAACCSSCRNFLYRLRRKDAA